MPYLSLEKTTELFDTIKSIIPNVPQNILDIEYSLLNVKQSQPRLPKNEVLFRITVLNEDRIAWVRGYSYLCKEITINENTLRSRLSEYENKYTINRFGKVIEISKFNYPPVNQTMNFCSNTNDLQNFINPYVSSPVLAKSDVYFKIEIFGEYRSMWIQGFNNICRELKLKESSFRTKLSSSKNAVNIKRSKILVVTRFDYAPVDATPNNEPGALENFVNGLDY